MKTKFTLYLIKIAAVALRALKIAFEYLFERHQSRLFEQELLNASSSSDYIQEYREQILRASKPSDFINSIHSRWIEKHQRQLKKRRAFAFSALGIMLLFFTTAFTFSPAARKIMLDSGSEVMEIVKPTEKRLVHMISVPDSLDFCGEVMPLQNRAIFKKMKATLLVSQSGRIQNEALRRKAAHWFPLIVPILKKYGVPEDFKYIPLVETGMANATSPKGAAGFWQLMAPTGLHYGLRIDSVSDERYNVIRSTIAASRYLRDLHRSLHSWTLVAAAYNMGLGGLKSEVNSQNKADYYKLILNKETAAYIYRTMAIKHILTKSKYGITHRIAG